MNIFSGKVKLILAFLFSLLVAAGCTSGDRLKNFDLQKEVMDWSDSSFNQVFITSTLPIDSADPKKFIFDIFRINFDKIYPDSIQLFARVYDSTGHFITNMGDPYKKDAKKKYFSALSEFLGKTYNIREVKVENFKVREYGALDSIPYNIVLTVDYSGSMSGVKEAIFQGTEIFVSLKSSYDSISLTTFNKDFSVKVPFESDKKQIINTYRVLRETGFGLFSAVNDAVWSAVHLFQGTSPDVPRILVVFSDGDDNYSKKEIGEIIRQAKEDQVHIFTVAFGYSKDDNLKYMAQYTGGKFYKAYNNDQLVSIFRDIYNSLKYYYLITYKPPKYWGYHKVIASLNVPGSKDTLKAMAEYDTSPLSPFSNDTVFERPILFDFNKFEIKPESGPIIDEIVDAMLSQPRLIIEIQGHTDNVGTPEYNQTLSENRAKAVYEALVSKGVETRRLRYRGFGMSVPRVSNDTEEGRARNRRTQFIILAK